MTLATLRPKRCNSFESGHSTNWALVHEFRKNTPIKLGRLDFAEERISGWTQKGKVFLFHHDLERVKELASSLKFRECAYFEDLNLLVLHFSSGEVVPISVSTSPVENCKLVD